jgi:CheY-like chemotaxis protein
VAPRVLLALSDDELFRTFATAIGSLGYAVELAVSPSKILDTVRERPPDATVLAFAAPPGINWALVSEIRALPGCQRLPICVIEAPRAEQRSREVGCEYLPSPVSLLALRNTVRRLLGNDDYDAVTSEG